MPDEHENAETAMTRFKNFVSEILTVTKEDIRKAEDAAKGIVDPELPIERADVEE